MFVAWALDAWSVPSQNLLLMDAWAPATSVSVRMSPDCFDKQDFEAINISLHQSQTAFFTGQLAFLRELGEPLKAACSPQFCMLAHVQR